jgi:hypothetical protein
MSNLRQPFSKGSSASQSTTSSSTALSNAGADSGWMSWIWSWMAEWFYGPNISLHDCLAYFFSADELKGDNMYSCEKCNFWNFGPCIHAFCNIFSNLVFFFRQARN